MKKFQEKRKKRKIPRISLLVVYYMCRKRGNAICKIDRTVGGQEDESDSKAGREIPAF